MDEEALVVAAVIEVGQGVLIAQRRSGLWEFPGGKVKAGETNAEALSREIMEELDCEIEVGKMLKAVATVLDDGRAAKIMFYDCRITKGAPTAKEHRKIMWVGRDELESIGFCGADAEFAKKL